MREIETKKICSLIMDGFAYNKTKDDSKLEVPEK